MRNYRFVLPQMSAIKRGESPHYANVDAKYMRQIFDRIRIDGPLKARNFESTTKSNAKWWNWKPTKRALEKLFMQVRSRYLPFTLHGTSPTDRPGAAGALRPPLVSGTIIPLATKMPGMSLIKRRAKFPGLLPKRSLLLMQ